MFANNVLNKLIFTIIFCSTLICNITNVRFILDMSSFMIISISNCCKHFTTKLTRVWLFSCVDSLMNLQITSFIEYFITKDLSFCVNIVSYRLMTNEFSFYFLTIYTFKKIWVLMIKFNFLISPLWILILLTFSIQSSVIILKFHSPIFSKLWLIIIFKLVIYYILFIYFV